MDFVHSFINYINSNNIFLADASSYITHVKRTNGFCALIDSHVHTSSGAIILIANSPSSLVTANSRILPEQNLAFNLQSVNTGAN